MRATRILRSIYREALKLTDTNRDIAPGVVTLHFLECLKNLKRYIGLILWGGARHVKVFNVSLIVLFSDTPWG